MGRAFIVEGDKTSHGGTVLEGSAFSTTNGRRIARLGDKVYCPHCKKTTSIIEGDPTMIVDGAPVALDGYKTSCGAVLITSQQATYKDMGGGNASSSNSSDAFASLFSPYVAEDDDVRMKFNDKFQLIDEVTNQPMANTAYAILRGSGNVEHGTTDENGHTNLLSSLIESESVAIYAEVSHD